MNYQKLPLELNSVGGEILDAFKYIPENPIAIVQLIHGMAEHIHRYENFAEFLAEKGYIVVGHTHAGHGTNAKILGYIADEDGWNILLKDIDSIRNIISDEYCDLPYFMFGHSMGSMLLRNYLQDHSDGLSGAIICGTAKQPLAAIKLGKIIASFQKWIGNSKKPSSLLNLLSFGAYNNHIANPRTHFDWLSRDDKQVNKYIQDPYCGFPFTASAYYDLFTGLENIENTQNNKNINKSLPIYIISGSNDPVGDNGKAIQRLYNEYKNIGIQTVDIGVYKEARHEILNEINNDEVYNDILKFLERILKC